MSSTPMPIPTGVPPELSDSTGTQRALKEIMAKIASLQQGKQAGSLATMGQGGAPQPTTAGHTGVAGAPPPLPFNPQGGGSAPQAAAPRALDPGPPMPAGFQTGMIPGSQDAVIQGTIGGVVQAIHQVNEKKKAEQTKKAENYMTQLSQAIQNGDQEMVNTMLSDPKIVKTIEKGLDYEFVKKPQAAAAKQEPEPPEATGIKAAISKMVHGKPKAPQPSQLPMPGQPGGIMLPKPSADQQSAGAISNARLDALKNDPDFLHQQATGSALSGEDNRRAEAIAKNLEISPKEVKILDAQQQIALQKAYTQFALEKMKSEAAMARTVATGEFKMNSAKIMADARKYAADITKEHLKITRDKADLQLPLAMLKHYDNMSKTYAQLAQKATDSKEKKFYQTQSEMYAQQYEKAHQDIEDQDLLKQYGDFLTGGALPGETPEEDDSE
jgi:hypothetical protein